MKILIAIIAFNEEGNILNAINELKASENNYDIVVIDNCSFDNTYKVCKDSGVKTLKHYINVGINGTWKTYFNYAYENDYDILCQYDSDGQHIATELRKIIEPIINNEADYVIGSRFINNEGFQSYFIRRIGINIFSTILSFLIEKRVKDVTSGFIAFNRKVIDFFALYYKHEIDQTMLLSYYAGARIMEIPVKMRERSHGKSFFNIMNALIFPFKSLVSILGIRLIKRTIIKEWTNKYES